MRKFTTSAGDVIESPYTHEEAMEKLGSVSGSFAQSLRQQYSRKGKLSERQWPWVHKLAVEADQPRKATAADVDLGAGKVIELFDRAAQNLKYPRVTLTFKGATVRFQRCGPNSKHPGSVNVTDGGGYHTGIWYGRINRDDGSFTRSRKAFHRSEHAGAVEEAIQLMAKDPVQTAIDLGKQSGVCCFCNAELTDERSTLRGYGPVCAKNFGLPHGAVSKLDVEKGRSAA